MAAGIEHRSVDSVMNAFDYFDKPNFSISAGRDLRTSCICESVDEASTKLREYLDMIEASNTAAIYTLRVYDGDTKQINSKTPSTGSTTFMLNPTQAVKTENGVTIIDRTVGSTGSNNNSNMFMQRLDKLEAENKNLLNQLHNEQISNLRSEFTSKIAGLSATPDVPWYDKIIDLLEKKPELLDKVSGLFGRITGHEEKNYIVQAAAPISGTEQKKEAMAEQTAVQDPEQEKEETDEPYKDPGLTAVQISDLTEDQQMDLQDAALESIEARIGIATVTRMILAVAALDDKHLNKLLNYLD